MASHSDSLMDFVLAEDDLIADVQFAIHNLLEAKAMSRAELARALGISEARVSQVFADNPKNLTLRTIARIFHAAGEKPRITSEILEEVIPAQPVRSGRISRRFANRDFIIAHMREAMLAQSTFQSQTNDNFEEADLVAA